jgi:hypothetical protein
MSIIYEYGVMRRAVASDIFKSSRLLFSFVRQAYFINPLTDSIVYFVTNSCQNLHVRKSVNREEKFRASELSEINTRSVTLLLPAS